MADCTAKYELKQYCEPCPLGKTGILFSYDQNSCELWTLCMNCIEINCTASALSAEKTTTEKVSAKKSVPKPKDSFLPG